MFFRVIAKDDIADLVYGFMVDHEVIGPVAKGDDFVFAPIDNASELRLDYDTTLLPPKKFFLPPKEQLMEFSVIDGEAISSLEPAVPRVIFGLHTCDLNGLLLLDNVFLSGYEDPYYKTRRDNTLLVGVSCTPRDTCFCNSFGTDESYRGFDIFLTDLGDRYFASVRSIQGADLIDHHVETRMVNDEDVAEFQRVTNEFKGSFARNVDTSQLPLLLDAKFDDPLWEELGERCLSCGACSMVCPTCYCFDVKDELAANGDEGSRSRHWDSCMFHEFAEVAQRHNFRGSRASRVKYRYYHKQWGYLSKFEKVLCVGCARCERACKADINPAVVIEALQAKGSE